jgi:hypothetical protein
MVSSGQTAASVTVPGYQHGNFADIIENSDWPE